MKLIKLSEKHYIVVDKSTQPVNGLYYDAFVKAIRNTSEAEYGKSSHCWQITRSTQPLELICCTPAGQIKRYIDCKGCDRSSLGYNEVKPLSLSEVKELLGEVDVEKKVINLLNESSLESKDGTYESFHIQSEAFLEGAKMGYTQALEDNKERKYTEEDITEAILRTIDACNEAQKNSYGELEIDEEAIIQSLQPKTEWDVEFDEHGKLTLV